MIKGVPNDKMALRRLFQQSVLSIMLVLLVSCVGMGEKRMGQAAIKNLETREVDASFDEVYAAATEALFDLGYTIIHSDKDSGVLVGEKRQKKSNRGWIIFGETMGGQKIPEKEMYDMLQLTLLVRPKTDSSSKVRIKTAVNKEKKLDKKAIDEVWIYIERQVLMEEDPSV